MLRDAGIGIGYATVRNLLPKVLTQCLLTNNEKGLTDAIAEISKDFPEVKIIFSINN